MLANDALEVTLPSVCSALSGDASRLVSRRGEIFSMPKSEFSATEYQAAAELAREINEGKRKLQTIDNLTVPRR